MLFYTVVKLTGRDFNACIKLLFSSCLEGGGGYRHPQARKPRDLPASYRPISLLSAHSCPQQVLRLVEYVSEGFETERSTVAVFFDVAKAFDRVWHAANRHFTFRHERTHSTRRLIRAGVPQGSTLSLLYSAYTNDVPRPSSSGVQLALFADDTALFTEIGIGAPDSPSSSRGPLTS
ncbi:Probable RNA-directed DNA polymerase from transposon BS [Eumeta japonica]|uniref:Probable RNA-directed DNA polymerase from transposon BS n=1 Tax=Eumeta variegata TaxID=151549 RepID=A0A4C1Z133_EUMVA|nr:Probable RNA-directed DNA polymerase from transposon BS [Eumeta japonica]